MRSKIPIILQILSEKYPDPKYELNWSTPFELLVATVLAARCKDKLVNQVTAELFKKYQRPGDYVQATQVQVEKDIKQVTFYQRKAQMLKMLSTEIICHFQGKVPNDIECLTWLTGVGRKSANVVMALAFNKSSGIMVDTHVIRVSQRLGLTSQKDPKKIEQTLMDLLPQETWIFFGLSIVLHGRYTCTYSKPSCSRCPVANICPKIGV